MTNPNHDTDPSTPGAKRQSDSAATAELGGSAVRARPTTTEPGLAPPGPMLPVPEEPMGIIVPTSSAQRLNDSVDVLLEGISREFPERPRAAQPAAPPVDDRSTAIYHAGHAVRAGLGTPPRDEPKVVIERLQLAKTARVARPSGPADEDDAREWTETTMVRAHPLVSRVVIALVAGIAVVVVIFVALERTSNERVLLMRGAPAPASPATAAMSAPVPAPAPAGAAPPATAGVLTSEMHPATAAAVPAWAPGESAPAPTVIAAESPPTPSAIASASGGPRRPPGFLPVKASRPRAKPVASAARPAAADLGEFKAAF
jgi:hypothetical protein